MNLDPHLKPFPKLTQNGYLKTINLSEGNGRKIRACSNVLDDTRSMIYEIIIGLH